MNKPLPRGEGAAYRFAADVGQGQNDITSRIQYQSSFGSYAAEFDYVGGQEHSSLEAAGGIVAIRGGGVHLTRPVEDGFAVIEVPGVRDVRGYVDNQEIGRTGRGGTMVVPDLHPYYANRLSIADGDVPLDHSVGLVELKLAPPLRGGVLAVFPVSRSQYVRGRLDVQGPAGAPIVPAFGELSVDAGGAGSALSPIGRGGEFELRDLKPGPHVADVEWEGGRCRFSLNVPSVNGPALDVGALHCRGLLDARSKPAAPRPIDRVASPAPSRRPAPARPAATAPPPARLAEPSPFAIPLKLHKSPAPAAPAPSPAASPLAIPLKLGVDGSIPLVIHEHKKPSPRPSGKPHAKKKLKLFIGN